MLRTALVLTIISAPCAFANDLLPGIRFSTHDYPAGGSAESFNNPPFEGLMMRNIPQQVGEDRAMQEFDLSGFAWQSIAVATISGTVTASDASNSGVRAFNFRLYAGNGVADLADHSVPAGIFGYGSYHPPSQSSFTYSFDVTHQLTTLMLGGATWIGMRVQCTSDWNLASILDLAPNTHLRILLETGSGFCFGDGSGTACPCGNDSPPGSGRGCVGSIGVGARLRGGGIASVANDTFTLRCTLLPNSFALFLQGTSMLNGGNGVQFGDGLRCAGGTMIRIATQPINGGVTQFPDLGDPPISVRGQVPAAGGLRHYQLWYRTMEGFCAPGTFIMSNGWSVAWAP